jgi:hypothetical protein
VTTTRPAAASGCAGKRRRRGRRSGSTCRRCSQMRSRRRSARARTATRRRAVRRVPAPTRCGRRSGRPAGRRRSRCSSRTTCGTAVSPCSTCAASRGLGSASGSASTTSRSRPTPTPTYSAMRPSSTTGSCWRPDRHMCAVALKRPDLAPSSPRRHMRYMAFQSWDPRVGHGPLPRFGSSRPVGAAGAKRLGQLARLALGAQPAWTLDQSVALGALAHYACLPCKGRLPGPVSGEPDAPLRTVPQEVNAPRPDTEAVALYRRTGAEKVSPVIASVSSAAPRSVRPVG